MVTNVSRYLDRPSLIVAEAFLDFKTTDGGGTDAVTLIPEAANEYGMVMMDCFGIVIEQFGGATEDQGVATIADTASSPNTLTTLTTTDVTPDAVNDIIVGAGGRDGASSGDAMKVVAAEDGVTVTITQQTSGSGEAGKMRVFAIFQPFMQPEPT